MEGGKTRLNRIFLIITLLFLLGADYSEEGFYMRRKNMIDSQIKARGVSDERVLKAMLKVKRHLFVPLTQKNLAYEDAPLPIGEGQTISQPYIVALMTELLELKGREKVLEIGTGSGYQTAILAELAKEVYTIELLKPLAERSRKLLEALGYENIKVKQGNGFLGWPEDAPFEAIIVTCAAEEIPPALLDQLAEGGRLVIPVGAYDQELRQVKKKEGKIISKDIIAVRFVPMLRDE
jgi:protein-L-isoaspartate(D-aspartate) O-methyltransferase